MTIPKQVMRAVIGIAVMVLAFGIVAGLFLLELPKGNREVAFTVLGVALGWTGAVVNYHFGTSEGSHRKTELMSQGSDK
ncbi:MAG: hypothetical protein U0975_08825 [Erythrobacter sp.]|nr:hypothetical protein [Erythrobacter sp.]MDZ4272761.1 hypothetical protein [Erythrobacter sp.]